MFSKNLEKAGAVLDWDPDVHNPMGSGLNLEGCGPGSGARVEKLIIFCELHSWITRKNLQKIKSC